MGRAMSPHAGTPLAWAVMDQELFEAALSRDQLRTMVAGYFGPRPDGDSPAAGTVTAP